MVLGILATRDGMNGEEQLTQVSMASLGHTRVCTSVPKMSRNVKGRGHLQRLTPVSLLRSLR